MTKDTSRYDLELKRINKVLRTVQTVESISELIWDRDFLDDLKDVIRLEYKISGKNYHDFSIEVGVSDTTLKGLKKKDPHVNATKKLIDYLYRRKKELIRALSPDKKEKIVRVENNDPNVKKLKELITKKTINVVSDEALVTRTTIMTFIAGRVVPELAEERLLNYISKEGGKKK